MYNQMGSVYLPREMNDKSGIKAIVTLSLTSNIGYDCKGKKCRLDRHFIRFESIGDSEPGASLAPSTPRRIPPHRNESHQFE